MKTLGVVVYENAQAMDIIGPWEVFACWRNTLKAPIEMFLISEQGNYVQCMNDISLKTHYLFTNSPQIDYLLVPGGTGRLKEIENKRMISFLQQQAQNAEYILSVCTGMFLLHKAGLLNHQSITTYWRALPEAVLLPDIHIVEERIVKNDKIWLAGGISSGIDLAFEFIKEIAGEEMAGKVQLLFEYFPRQHTYCTPELLHSLPLYYGNEANQTHLPTYVNNYLSENEKKK
ncbi:MULTISPECIES: DJ-1/PfpI family protein [Legionella]|uniref:ThiJ/PfpI family protein n=1 Tax=Legionella maceachernii TaxID=466 RepID=A0A0W0W0Z3_9GAMM|nr:DJ-1/PfpI family protein [Legionella maceachernii]KTD25574.1 ThiJ/PfpI family protein [Legionella maceachernii]SJZ56577.1 transcriptional regulator, AraC family [Legionella maceachernii]SUP00526.1 transcriptional activator FtrA [Legionella maceachernii]